MTALSVLYSIWLALFPYQLGPGLMGPGPGVKGYAASCTSPTGTTLSESFGDSSTSCWTSGPSACNNTWTRSGSNSSIITPTAGAPSNTVCSGALQFAAAGTTDYIYKSQSLPAATPVDIYAYLYITSHSIGSFSSSVISSVETNIGAVRGNMVIRNDGGSLYLRGQGSTTGGASGTTGLTTGAWYKVHLHLESGSDASYVDVNDGTQATFTQNSNDGTRLFVGHQANVTVTNEIGVLWVN